MRRLVISASRPIGVSILVSCHHCTNSPSHCSIKERRIEEVYELLDNKPIGMGGFGIVCPGRHRETGEVVAVKSVAKKSTTRERMKKEAEVMRLAGDHRGIVDFVDLFEGDNHWYLVMEMASGGELFDRLINKGPYTEEHASVVIREVAEALSYLHQQGIVHFDLKPENILLHGEPDMTDVIPRYDRDNLYKDANTVADSTAAAAARSAFASSSLTLAPSISSSSSSSEWPASTPGLGRVATSENPGGGGGVSMGATGGGGPAFRQREKTLLTDFGSAFLTSASASERTPKPGSGTSAYLPPEALVTEEHQRRPCTPAADMWSLGVVLYILLAGAHPFDLSNDASDQEIERRIREDDPPLEGSGAWGSVTSEGRDLLRQLLDKDPAKRPTAQQVLLHPWLQGGAELNKEPLEDAAENLRKLHRGRKRLKALLLATMLGLDLRKDNNRSFSSRSSRSSFSSSSSSGSGDSSASTGRGETMGDEAAATAGATETRQTEAPRAERRRRGGGERGSREADLERDDPLGSRRAALSILDRGTKGYVTADDLRRAAQERMRESLSDGELREMLRGADKDPHTTPKWITAEHMLKLVPPLCPARFVEERGAVFVAGETDPQAYLVTQGEVNLSFMPRRGAAPLEALRTCRGDLVGADELLGSSDEVLPRLHSAHCATPGGCRLLVVQRGLFSHLTDVFSELEEHLFMRASSHLRTTLETWLRTSGTTNAFSHPRAQVWPPPPGKATTAQATAEPTGLASSSSSSTTTTESSSSSSSISNNSSSRGGSVSYPPAVVRTGCLLLLQQGELEVEVVLPGDGAGGMGTSIASASSNGGMLKGMFQRLSMAGKHPHHRSDGNALSDDGVVVEGQRALRMRVGPGFLCYCAPAHRVTSSSSLVPGGAAAAATTQTTTLFDPKQVPPALRGLPRLVHARCAAPPLQSGSSTAGAPPASRWPDSRSAVSKQRSGALHASSSGPPQQMNDGDDEASPPPPPPPPHFAPEVVATMVPGRDLGEFLKQPGMAPLRAFIQEQTVTSAAVASADRHIALLK